MLSVPRTILPARHRSKSGTHVLIGSNTSAGDSDIGIYGMSPMDLGQSGLMPADLTTLPHFSISSLTNLPNSPGELGMTVAPSSAIRAKSPRERQ